MTWEYVNYLVIFLSALTGMPLYTAFVVRVCSKAYFDCKLQYQRAFINSIDKGR